MHMEKHHDLISAMCMKVSHSPLWWRWRHIKGHQDDDEEGDLDKWALLNIEMDALTKAYWWWQVDCQAAPQQKIEDECWRVWLGDWKVVTNMVDYHTRYCAGLAMLEYWTMQRKFPMPMALEINWGMVDKAAMVTRSVVWRWSIKHNIGMCRVGKWRARWKHWSHQACPHCRQPEDVRHIILCPEAEEA